MPMYNLIEYNDNYRKTSGFLWQYYRDEPALTAAGAFDNFRVNNYSGKLSKNISWHLKNCNGQGHVYTNGCLLDYTYFKEYDKKIAIDLSNLSALDADPKAIQQINFTGNIDWDRVATTFFIIEEAK